MERTRSTAEIGPIRFVIEPSEATAMMARLGAATAEELLQALVPAAMRLARPAISNFPVGAVGLGSSGRIYVGVNVEFPGLPLHHSIHAEQFLVANAAAHGEAELRRFAVSHEPCGHCRQFLQEIRRAPEIEIVVTSDGGPNARSRPLAALLPNPFGPQDLLDEDHPLLLEPHCNKIEILEEEEEEESPEKFAAGGEAGGFCNGIAGKMEERLREAAAAAARAAHAPYSGCPSGFAVADAGGKVFAGAYAESAAYNPSLGPVQAAAVAYVAGGGGCDAGDRRWEIVAAALVEKDGAEVSQEGTARVFLAAVAPRAHLRVYRFRRPAAAA